MAFQSADMSDTEFRSALLNFLVSYVARDTASANRERVRERLSNIVRSKEGCVHCHVHFEHALTFRI